MDAFEREHRDQRGRRRDDLAGEAPHHIHGADRRQRPEQIDDVHVADEAIGELGEPPRQRRMLPVAELPFLAERQILGEIELQIAAHDERQRGPDSEMEGQHPRQRRLRPLARPGNGRVDWAMLRRVHGDVRHVVSA
jgi:hypothetical protein